MWIPFAHHQGLHHAGAHRALASSGMEKVLVVFLAFILAVVARYAATMWAERESDNPASANMAGWLAFFVVLVVIGVGGVKLL